MDSACTPARSESAGISGLTQLTAPLKPRAPNLNYSPRDRNGVRTSSDSLNRLRIRRTDVAGCGEAQVVDTGFPQQRGLFASDLRKSTPNGAIMEGTRAQSALVR